MCADPKGVGRPAKIGDRLAPHMSITQGIERSKEFWWIRFVIFPIVIALKALIYGLEIRRAKACDFFRLIYSVHTLFPRHRQWVLTTNVGPRSLVALICLACRIETLDDKYGITQVFYLLRYHGGSIIQPPVLWNC